MSLDLPPASIIRQSEDSFKNIHSELTKVIAGHPGAVNTYTFYEEVDRWLGPWGPRGYPIGYGKFYNVAFSENANLMRSPLAKAWVWKTTIELQEALRDFIVEYFKSQPLITLTEPVLRKAAFESHPHAYDKGGLATVALAAPELLPIIASIPAAEFDPRSRDFTATVEQVFETVEIVAPKAAGGAIAALAGPAHTGVFRRAAQQDQRRFLNEVNTSRRLASLRTKISSGHMDYVPLLDKIIAELNATEFPDQGFARAAREVINAAENRKRIARSKTILLLNQSPEVKSAVLQKYPETIGQ